MALSCLNLLDVKQAALCYILAGTVVNMALGSLCALTLLYVVLVYDENIYFKVLLTSPGRLTLPMELQ